MTDDDFAIAPADGLSPEEREARSRIYPPVQPPPEAPRPFQFSMSHLLLTSVVVGVGLAGSHWMPTQAYAGVLGLLMLATLIWGALIRPQATWLQYLWLIILCAYLIACAMALLPLGR